MVYKPKFYPNDSTTCATDYQVPINYRLAEDWNFPTINIFESINDLIKEEKRRQKRIDRIAWKAETAQRFAKGRHFR